MTHDCAPVIVAACAHASMTHSIIDFHNPAERRQPVYCTKEEMCYFHVKDVYGAVKGEYMRLTISRNMEAFYWGKSGTCNNI